jgi:hypothetical protein
LEYIYSVASPVTIAEVQRPSSEQATTGASSSRARFVRWRPLAAALVCAALVAGVVLAVRNPAPNEDVEAGPATSASADGAWPRPFGSEDPVPVVPDGWKVLDFGDLRFAVPDDWAVPVSRSCLGLASGEAGAVGAAGAVLVRWGEGEGPSCGPIEPLPASVLTIEPVEPGLGSGERAAVGTLSATRIANESCAECGPIYQFENGLQLTITGPEADAVLATFTDSGAHRALQAGPVAESSDWRAVDYEGIKVRVPTDWAIVDLPGSYQRTERPDGSSTISRQLNPGECGGAMFASDQLPRVSLGESPITASCPPVGRYDLEAGDGLWIRPIDDAAAALLGTPIAQGDVGGLSVTAVRLDGSQRQRPSPVLDLLVRTGSATLWVTLGVGQDASAARAILQSLQAE